MTATRVPTALVIVALALVARAADPPSRFLAALLAAEANEATESGSEFDEAVAIHFGETHGDTLAACSKGAMGKDLERFNLVMRLDETGTVAESMAFPETSVARCLRIAVAHDTFPKPMHPDYWVRVEMSFRP